MGKYSHANVAIEAAVTDGDGEGFSRAEMLLALIVSAVHGYKETAGRDEARVALKYELDNLGGNLDTTFLRSR